MSPDFSSCGPVPTPAVDSAAHPTARRALLKGLLGVAGVSALAGVAKAGPLTPPAGPVSSSGKTLTDVEPRTPIGPTTTPGDGTATYVISQPGSYYLTGGITTTAGKAGIRIAASRVTIDLMGFTISGPGSAGITDGGAALSDIRIHSGSVAGVGGIGISLTTSDRTRLERMTARGCAGTGFAAGQNCHAEDLDADQNTATPGLAGGISLGDQAAVVTCNARGNTGGGIRAGVDSRCEECVCTSNTGIGIEVQGAGRVERCMAGSNGGAGISGPSTIGSSLAVSNTGRGVTTTRAAIMNSTSYSNGDVGFSTGGGGTISGCVAAWQTGTAAGFSLGSVGVAESCVAYRNAGTGIAALQHGRVNNCVARGNTGHGISGDSGTCYITRNSCSDNGVFNGSLAGIWMGGVGGRIEGNLCSGNQSYGIYVTAAANVIVRNTCSTNRVNWSIFSNCIFGTVVDRTSPGVSGMSGNGTVASTMGTTDPFANISL